MKVVSCYPKLPKQILNRPLRLLSFLILSCRKFQILVSFTLFPSFFFLSLSFFLSFFLTCLLYFVDRAGSAYIYKYSLRTELIEATITVSSFTSRKNHYQWGGFSAMDLAVDEQGLWVLWGSTANSGKLYACKIDVYRNVITDTWSLNTGKHILYQPLQNLTVINEDLY